MKRFFHPVIRGTLLLLCMCFLSSEAGALKLHRIFTDHMVIQRDKPITIWGWADPGDTVAVRLGDEQSRAVAEGEAGRWEVTFPARPASNDPIVLVVSSGDERVERQDILIGDVWVMYGQSNMAWSLKGTIQADMEIAQSNLPRLRHFRIMTNEQQTLQADIRADAIANGGWEVSSPESSAGFSAIGYVFGSRLQMALGIPIGIITSARGGASIESLVPAHKFDDHPLAKRYADSVEEKMASFDMAAAGLQAWEREVARAKSRGVPEGQWPPKPVSGENLRSWNIPGKSPSDRASVYNGMFGVFKGYNIKGMVFHQGYNNAMGSNCRPMRYRVLMKLMVEGIREDFRDPALPIAVIGFCAGGETQNEDNFERLSLSGGAFIRESQRLGLADAGQEEVSAFIPAYDVQIPGLHPKKKREHGLRAARWALARIYQIGADYDNAKLISAETQGDEIVLTFDKKVMPDDMSSIPRGFAIAGEDGKFYLAYARYEGAYDKRGARLTYNHERIHVWSPLVETPVAVRYGWATSPMGNLKVNGHPDLPLPSFRTDQWDLPESEDPAEYLGSQVFNDKALASDLAQRVDERREREAADALKITERLKQLGVKPEVP